MRGPVDYLCVLTLAFAIGRLLITPRLNLPTATGSYEAAVHLYVGLLMGIWLIGRRTYYYAATASWAAWMAIGLTVWEVLMFLIQKAS